MLFYSTIIYTFKKNLSYYLSYIDVFIYKHIIYYIYINIIYVCLNHLNLLSEIDTAFFPGEREAPLGMARGAGSLSPRAGAAVGKKPLE